MFVTLCERIGDFLEKNVRRYIVVELDLLIFFSFSLTLSGEPLQLRGTAAADHQRLNYQAARGDRGK